MPTPGNFPDNWEEKNEKDENDEIEKGQESESWAKEAWSVFKNKLDEYKNSDLAIGMKMYASDTVDFVKSKVEALSKSERLTFLNGLAREGTFIVAAKNDLMEKVSENFSYNFKNEQLRNFFQNSSEIFKGEKEQNYADLEKLENGEMKDLGIIKGVGTGGGTLIKYGKLAIGSATAMGGALMGTMAIGHYSEVAKKTRLQAESVIEKTRVGQLDENGELIDKDDFDRAWDEAYRLYNEATAKSENGEVSARDLDKIYQENLPKDILDRIERNENFDGLGLLQKGMITIMKNNAQEIEAEFLQIENSDKTVEEKALEMQAIIRRNEKLLEELDGMVSDQGTIDTYAALAKISEKTGKMATLLVTLGITAEGIHKAWDSLKEVNLSHFSDNVANLRNHFMNWTGKELNAAETKFMNPHYNLDQFDQTNLNIKTEIEHIRTANGGVLTAEDKLRIEQLHKDQLEIMKAQKENDLSKLDKFKTPLEKAADSNVKEGEVKKYSIPGRGGVDEGSGTGLKGGGKTPDSHFKIAENVKVGKNDSIWKMGEKYLQGNQKFVDLKGDKGVEKALETYNIDRIKDEIVAHPENYGLPKNVNFEKLSAKQLSEIKWQEAFDKVFVPPTGKEITETLTDQQVKGVLASNRAEYEKRFGHEHHGGGKGHTKPLSGIDAPPRAKAELVPDDLEAFENVPDKVAPIDDTKIIIDGSLTIDKDSQFADEWKIWKNRSADDFLQGRYGEPIVAPEPYKADGKLEWEKDIVHHRPDALEMRNREELRGRLENARHIIKDPREGETVGDYMARYNLESAEPNDTLYKGLFNSGALNGNADFKAEVSSIINRMPGELKKALSADFAKNKEVVLGYVKLFAGDKGGVSEGIKKFFDHQGQINPESIKIKPDGSILYENAFGKNNYDLQISKDKVGVDGPLFRNMEKTGLSLDSIKNAKVFIIEGPVSKTVAEATMDMGKGGEVVGEKGAEVIKPEVKIDAGSEKVVPVVEKNVGSGKGKMLDISIESEVEKGDAGGGKMIDLDE